MSIKSKKWYENQITALKNAAKNTNRLIETTDSSNKIFLAEICKRNQPIQKECKKIYQQLNNLENEYHFYYK